MNTYVIIRAWILLELVLYFRTASALSISRRKLLVESSCLSIPTISSLATVLSSTTIDPATAQAATVVASGGPTAATATSNPQGLAARLALRDPAQLQNKIFNIPPSLQVYPEWMRGSWKVKSNFAGYLFPSKKIGRDRLVQDVSIAGFQKCSVAQIADVGKDNVVYEMQIDTNTGYEDRTFNLQSMLNAYLGYNAVNSVVYNGQKNPNRIGIDFVDYRTVNAERIELFCNARESESTTTTTTSSGSGGVDQQTMTPLFVSSEYIRQVTFGTGSTYGVPRQVITNYAHFWTWKAMPPTGKNDDDNNNNDGEKKPQQLKGNLLTAAFLDPQDALYFDEPTMPVVIYAHDLVAERMSASA